VCFYSQLYVVSGGIEASTSIKTQQKAHETNQFRHEPPKSHHKEQHPLTRPFSLTGINTLLAE
jgi:hypothetical protein